MLYSTTCQKGKKTKAPEGMHARSDFPEANYALMFSRNAVPRLRHAGCEPCLARSTLRNNRGRGNRRISSRTPIRIVERFLSPGVGGDRLDARAVRGAEA